LAAILARLVLLAAPLAALAVAGCGGGNSDSSGSTVSAQQRPGGPGRFLSDPKVRSCLEKQGVTLPNRQRPNGTPPPNGQRPNRDRGDSAQFQKLREALEKCGVTFPNRGGQPPSPQGTTSSSAS
jgi:hypothetical protein